jgi:MFS family permease
MRTFYTLTLTQLLSLIGSRMTGIVVGIRVFQETGSAAPLLIAAFFAETPSMVGGVLSGLLADRLDRRHVIRLGDAGQAVGTLLLIVSFASGAFQVWHLYLAMLIQGIFSTIQAPAAMAAITVLVPDDQRDRANGINGMGFNLAGVVAPVLGGLAYTLVGITGVMAFDLFTFAVAVIVVTRITLPRPPQSAEDQASRGSLRREMLAGWHFLQARRALLGTVIYLSFIFFLINGPLEMALPYLLSITGSEATAGLLLGVMSLGALAGSVTIALVGRVHDRMRAILGSYLLLGAMLIAFGLARHPLLIAPALFLAMYPLPLAGALFNSVLQIKTPPDVQGRVFAVTGQLFTLTTPFSFLITAALVDHVLEPAVHRSGWRIVAPLLGRQDGSGMGLLLVIVGAIILITTLAVAALPHVRRLESTLPDYATAAAD